MIPVVLIHKHGTKDDRYPLNLVISQAERFGNTVVLIEDGPEAKVKLADYWGEAAKFEQYYVHMSGNHASFEKLCFARWYVLAAWMQANEVDRVLYTDSDVLLYCNAEQEYEPYKDCGLTLALGSSAATSYFTLSGLNAFLDYVDSIYVGRNAVFAEFERIYREMQAQHLAGGVSDMLAFKFFKEQVKHVKVGEMTEVHDWSTWDHSINSRDGFDLSKGIKYISWGKCNKYYGHDVPYGTIGNGTEDRMIIRFNALHFQGQAKRIMREYVR